MLCFLHVIWHTVSDGDDRYEGTILAEGGLQGNQIIFEKADQTELVRRQTVTAKKCICAEITKH